MKTKIVPGKNNFGPITLPASKSLMHRALICAAFADGISTIKGITINDDILATISCLENFGISFKLTDKEIIVHGKKEIECQNSDFYPHESGSTLRFIIPFVNLCETEVKFYFEGLLGTRPLDCYQKIWQENEIYYNLTREKLTLRGKFKNNLFTLKGNISSQFVSGLLMMLPLLPLGGEVCVLKPFESKSYVDLTISVMKAFGVEIEMIEEDAYVLYKVIGPTKYQTIEYTVEADYSQSAFFFALGTLNEKVSINNLFTSSLQGDSAIVDFLKQLNCKITYQNGMISLEKPIELKTGLCIDLANCPDLGPILMAIASQISGKTRFINTRRLMLKESNRALAMKEELVKIGAIINVFENEIIVNGTTTKANGQVFNSHKDHRICMSLAILATVLQTPSVIIDSECINKSYPTFFETLEKLQIEVQHE